MRLNRKILHLILIIILSVFCLSEEKDQFNQELTEIGIMESEISAKILNIKGRIENLEKEILFSREVIPSPLINEYKTELLKLETEMKKELMTYREKHPVIKKIQAQIDIYETRLKDEIEKTSEKKIYSQNPEYLELVSSLNALETELVGIKTRRQELQRLSDLEKIRTEIVKQNKITQEIRISEITDTKEKEIPGKSNTRIFLSILLIILLCILGYLVKKVYSGKKRTKDENEGNIIGKLDNVQYAGSESGISEEAVLINDPDNNLKKCIRKIADNIASRGKTFIVTSLEKNTGKTFLSVNLAAFWANRKEKVLLIDANFRQPKIHRMFLKDNDTGLADMLAGNNSQIIKHTVPDIDIICAGHNPVGSDEMLESTEFLDIIKNLEEDYAHIIIDMGNMRDNTEPFVIGKYFPVVGVIRKEKDSTVFEKICEMHSNVMAGTVLNK